MKVKFETRMKLNNKDIKIRYTVHPQIILDNLILGPYKEP